MVLRTVCSFGCQHFQFTFWLLHACVGLVLGGALTPAVYYAVGHFSQPGLFERINMALNTALVAGFAFIWVLKCNKL